MEYLVIEWCHHLTSTPNFSGCQNLRRLSFAGCSSLLKVHSSIGESGKLVSLSFDICQKLKKLPKNFSHLRSLQDLSMWRSLELKASPEIFGSLTSLQRLFLERTSTYGVLSNLSHLFNLQTIQLNFCKNQEVLQQLPHTVEESCKSLKMLPILPPNLELIDLNGCENLEMLPELPLNLEIIRCKDLKMLPELPLNLYKISLSSCKNLKMLPKFPPNVTEICVGCCKNLKMLPPLPQNLQCLSASNCKLLETVSNLSNCTGLRYLSLISCKKLKEFKGWENLHSIRTMRFGGVSHIDFSESIKEVLKHSTNSNGLLACNEIPGCIRCQKEKSSISFQYPSVNLKNHTLKFYGFVYLVVLNPAPLLPPHYFHYDISIQKHDSKAFPQTWYDYRRIQLEVEGISFLHVITINELYHRGYGDIKAGEVIKATPTT
nr:TMV resistance protein N-like [Ipomoea batatas]